MYYNKVLIMPTYNILKYTFPQHLPLTSFLLPIPFTIDRSEESPFIIYSLLQQHSSRQQINKMSYPQYLNRIINFQSNIKEVENIRQEITKFLPTLHRQSKKVKYAQGDAKGKTLMNFNVISMSQLGIKQNTLLPNQTLNNFSKQQQNKRLAIPLAKLHEVKVAESEQNQQETMLKWRQQMLKHLKKPSQNKFAAQLQQIEVKSSEIPQIIEEEYKSKESIIKLKKSQTMSTAMMRTFKSRRKSVNQALTDDNRADNADQNKKRLILINPQPLYEDAKIKIKLKYSNFKTKKSMFFLRHKKESDSPGQLARQSHSNFKALFPFLGAKKAIVQAKVDYSEQKKKLMQQIMKERLTGLQKKSKGRIVHEDRVIQISAWETTFQ